MRRAATAVLVLVAVLAPAAQARKVLEPSSNQGAVVSSGSFTIHDPPLPSARTVSPPDASMIAENLVGSHRTPNARGSSDAMPRVSKLYVPLKLALGFCRAVAKNFLLKLLWCTRPSLCQLPWGFHFTHFGSCSLPVGST